MNQSNKHQQSLIDALITNLIDEMHLNARARVANLNNEEVIVLELALGKYLNYRLEQLNDKGNDELLNECRERSGYKSLDDAGESGFILMELWKNLKEMQKLRVEGCE